MSGPLKIRVNHANLSTSLMKELLEAQVKADGKDSNGIVPDNVVLRGTSMPNERKVTWFVIKSFIRDIVAGKRKIKISELDDLKHYLGEGESVSSSSSKRPRTELTSGVVANQIMPANPSEVQQMKANPVS